MVARIATRSTLRTNRVPGDLVRALGKLYLELNPEASRESLANRIVSRLEAAGINYHVRTIRRQLTGRVATVPPAVEAALKEELYQATGRRSNEEIEGALSRAGIRVLEERRQPEYVSSDRVVPLAELWLLLNPARSRRSLARELARTLAERGIHIGVDPLQGILAGRQPTARRQVHEELLVLLSQHGIRSESEARETREHKRDEFVAYGRDRMLQSPERFLAMVRAWKVRKCEPSSRKLAGELCRRLSRRGMRPSQRRVQEAVDGNASHVRTALVSEMERMLREALPDGATVESAIEQARTAETRLQDLRWVRADAISELAKRWLSAHPGVTMRQLSLRVAKTARRMGYHLSPNTVQPILGGHKRRTRGFVYRALLRHCVGPRAGVPTEHFLQGSAAATRRRRSAEDVASREAPPTSPALSRCCGGLRPPPRLDPRPGARLSHAEEIDLVRTIGEADRRIVSLVLMSDVAAPTLSQLFDQVERGALEPWDVLVVPKPDSLEAVRRTREHALAVLRKLAALGAKRNPLRLEWHRAGATFAQTSELRRKQATLTGQLMDVLGGARLARRYVKAMADRFAALVAEAEAAGARSDASGREALRRVEAEAGLGLEELRRIRSQIDEETARAAAAKSTLVAAHQWLVVAIAKRCRWRGLELPDLVAEGNLGLLHALDKFDVGRGCRVSTYASWWIRHQMDNAAADTGKNIRLPRHLTGQVRRLRRAAHREYQRRGSCSALQDLAVEVGLSADDPRALLALERGTISLQAPVGGSDVTLEHFLADEAAVSPADATAYRELASRLDTVLDTLESRDAAVLRLRYGLAEGRTHSLEEVGRRFGLSRERVRQIQDKALQKLRGRAGSRPLREFLETNAPERKTLAQPKE